MKRLALLIFALLLACAIDYQHNGKRSCWSCSCAYDMSAPVRCILPRDEPKAGVPPTKEAP